MREKYKIIHSIKLSATFLVREMAPSGKIQSSLKIGPKNMLKICIIYKLEFYSMDYIYWISMEIYAILLVLWTRLKMRQWFNLYWIYLEILLNYRKLQLMGLQWEMGWLIGKFGWNKERPVGIIMNIISICQQCIRNLFSQPKVSLL